MSNFFFEIEKNKSLYDQIEAYVTSQRKYFLFIPRYSPGVNDKLKEMLTEQKPTLDDLEQLIEGFLLRGVISSGEWMGLTIDLHCKKENLTPDNPEYMTRWTHWYICTNPPEWYNTLKDTQDDAARTLAYIKSFEKRNNPSSDPI